MTVLQAIVLGAVQGFTEFLPVSSSGHLILLQRLFGIENNVLLYSVLLHVGTLIPVVVVLFKDILKLIKNPSKFGYLVLASIPAGIVGLALSALIDLDTIFSSHIWLLSITFLLTAAELILSERRANKVKLKNDINFKTSLIMGAGQAFGVVPGLSRSGTTLSFGTLAGVKKEENASFTFLMSIPIILAAALMEGYKCYKIGFSSVEVLPLVIGVLTAMVTGYIAIKFMLKIIKKHNYKWFSLYLVGISIFTIITHFVGL